MTLTRRSFTASLSQALLCPPSPQQNRAGSMQVMILLPAGAMLSLTSRLAMKMA